MMKKIYLGIAIAAILAGCGTTKAPEKQLPPREDPTNLIYDPDFSLYRANNGGSVVWNEEADKNNGYGDAGTSKTTAFGPADGSVRLRFINPSDDFTATPGISQIVKDVEPNTDYAFSFYYYDKRGNNSVAAVEYGVISLTTGKSIATKTVNANEVRYNPSGDVTSGFHQTYVVFNSGNNTSLKVYAKLIITDPSKIDKKGDIGRQTEVRLDNFKLKKE